MYETNFGFHRQPFQCADLTRAFFISESIRTVLPQLLHALRSDLGIAVLTGPAGVGKTSLLKHLQVQLAHEGRAVLCSGAGLETPSEVLQTLQAASLLRAGESSHESAISSVVRSRWTVVEQMRKTTEFWGPILLLIDDAQLLSVPVLNELRAFTEEEWNGRALVRCLIAGPLNLEEELARPAHADFSRRVRCHAFLEPLSSKESLECLNRHLSVVGGKLKDVFSPKALDLIAVASDGLPRCLTLLADESLIVAAERSTKLADEDCVRTALTRLQHLAYAWNTSPLISDHQSDLVDSVTELPGQLTNATTSHAASTVTHIAAGVFEFGVPGVIEFGSVSSERPAITRSSSATPESLDCAIPHPAMSHEPAEDYSPPATQQLSSAVFEIGSTPTQSFEVGHRYQPDALEATDAVEMDAFTSTSLEDSESQLPENLQLTVDEGLSHHVITELEADGDSSVLNVEIGAPVKPARAERHVVDSDFDSADAESTAAAPSRPVHFMSSMADHETQEQIIRTAIGSELSSRLPVFDRYTWIALGREVPSGTYAVASASDMQRASDNEFGAPDEWLTKDSFQNMLAFDRIPVSRTDDSEIMMMLKSHQTESEQGDFITFRPAPVFGQGVQTTIEQPNTESMTANCTPAPTSVAHIQQPGEQNNLAEADEDNVISDANRELIQNAIRSSLLASLADTASATPAVDAFDVTDTFAVLEGTPTPGYTGITEQFEVNGWHDGQLIFNSRPADLTVSSATPAGTEMAPEPERVSLNFEAARLARDGQAMPSRELTGSSNREPEHSAPKFYSLPTEVRTLEWDLRGDILSTDDAGPLADTLASLRDEVTKFQNPDRMKSLDDSQTIRSTGDFSDRNSGESPKNLVTVARNRLEPLLGAERQLSPGIGTATDAAILTQPVSQTLGTEPTRLPVETAVLPDATSSPADNRSPTGATDSGDFGPRYSQLFTKLRQVRSRVAGNR